MALFVLLVGLFAAPARAQAPAPSEDSPDVHSLWTFVFLDNLALERLDEPSPVCRQLYVDLDRALDRLVDTNDWQHLVWQFSRSGIYTTLDAMQSEECDDDLSHEPSDELPICRELRAQGRRQLYRLEHSKHGQAIIHGRAMHSFQAHVHVGRAAGCLTSHTPPDAA